MKKESVKISIPLLIGGLILVIVISAGGIFLSIRNNKDTNTNNTSDSSTVTNDTSTNLQDQGQTNDYKDGTYVGNGSYKTPETTEEIEVTLTIKDNTITKVSLKQDPQDRDSEFYQAKFKSGISSVVVGKKLDSVTVGRVNGSSLTGKGFNIALNEIKDEAKI